MYYKSTSHEPHVLELIWGLGPQGQFPIFPAAIALVCLWFPTSINGTSSLLPSNHPGCPHTLTLKS
jgi:hypothetical protein